MRILLVHNHYGSGVPSGENRVFELEKSLLIRAGYVVETFERHSDNLRALGKIGLLKGALITPWNPATFYDIRKTIKRFQPDIVHAHNTFPIISPSIFSAAKGSARILTLHNYRLLCPAAIPMRGGDTCTECIDRRTVKPAVRYGCYRSSRLATFPLATSVALHRVIKTWNRNVEAFIALSDFQRDIFVRAGMPGDRIHVKPNFFPGVPERIAYEKRKHRVVFVGRLGAEKGIGDLIEAWLRWGPDAPELRIVGDGDLRELLQARCAGVDNIKFLGQLDSRAAEKEIAAARLLVLPSRCFEGFPMVLREAFAFGTPVAVSNQGPLPDIVAPADGVVFRSGDPGTLLENVRQRLSDRNRLRFMSDAGMEVFRENYSESVNIDKLLEIYERAIKINKEGILS